jgi:hypothetical protein
MTKTQLSSLISMAIVGSLIFAACGSEQTTCFDQGTRYEIGQTFKRDCNTCTCTAEGIACTLMGCLPSTGGATTHTGGAGGVPGSGGAGGIAGSTGAGGTAGSSGTGGAKPNPDVAPQGCVEGGRTYVVGETFKRDCNTCTCTANGAICTEMACAVDAAPDLPRGPDAGKTCLLGGREYTIGETFKSDCNTCTCTSNGIACTAMFCYHDGGPDLPRAVDGNSACVLSANLTFGHDGGYVSYSDVNRLTATTFTITRNYTQRADRDGATMASCSPNLPACGATGAVTVATINADLADPDVQGVWALPQDPVPIFGSDPRLADGTVYSIALDDGRKVLVGGQCASPAMSSCRYIPAGLLQLTQDLQSLAAAMIADPVCTGVL